MNDHTYRRDILHEAGRQLSMLRGEGRDPENFVLVTSTMIGQKIFGVPEDGPYQTWGDLPGDVFDQAVKDVEEAVRNSVDTSHLSIAMGYYGLEQDFAHLVVAGDGEEARTLVAFGYRGDVAEEWKNSFREYIRRGITLRLASEVNDGVTVTDTLMQMLRDAVKEAG